MITSEGDSKMSSRRVKTSGWAAFDLKQRQKDGIVAQSGDELFPSLGTTITSLQPSKTSARDKHVKSFSSAIQPSLHFPTLKHDNVISKSSEVDSSESPHISELTLEVKFSLVFKQLKEIFVWADDSLIEDIMAATGNDVDKASSFLKAMVSDQRSHELDITEVENHNKLMSKKEDESSKDVHEPAKMSSVTEPRLGSKNNNVSNEFAQNLYNDYMEINAIVGQLTSIAVEPEWEEDDVYLSCRKDAIKKIRAATRHSKAATNSFLRGDHKSAQQFSLKAREDWGVAQSLNAKAACEILRIRNENNGIWRLDLHGLHASEAVKAVKERLFMIETQGSRQSDFPNSSKSMPVNKSEEQASYRLKPIWLEVITGIGNHSRGGAALPTAVKTYLVDNGYRFDEDRPGVIMVRPKFRANGKPTKDINMILQDRLCEKMHELTFKPVKAIEEKQKFLREQDELYLRCRKEAFEMITIASRFSEERKNAYAQVDHKLAKQLSEKLKIARKAVCKLNTNAAQEIFQTINKKNGTKKIDLHGLHPSEAIHAVKKRLNTIETKSKILCTLSSIEKPFLLEVITGISLKKPNLV